MVRAYCKDSLRKPVKLCYTKYTEKQRKGENLVENVEKVKRSLIKSGVENYGFCSFSAVSNRLISCRAKARLPIGARSVICAAFPYHIALSKRNISRYAVVADYHTVVLARLQTATKRLQEAFCGYSFAPFSDNSPIPEVRAAVLCGLGVKGDNGLFIHPRYGSWVFLGEIVTDLPLPAAKPQKQDCLHCGLCEKKCPAGAIHGGALDESRCLSAVTQKKGELSPEEQALIQANGLAWGCDGCQECCPLNARAKQTDIEEFLHSAVGVITPDDVSRRKDRAFLWRGEGVIRRNLRILAGESEQTSQIK